jgi:uncharacterized protein with PCYCGC motif
MSSTRARLVPSVLRSATFATVATFATAALTLGGCSEQPAEQAAVQAPPTAQAATPARVASPVAAPAAAPDPAPSPASEPEPQAVKRPIDIPESRLRPLPETSFPAARPMDVVKAVFAFAARRPDVLSKVPCFCGCERMGHRGNDDCFVKSRDAHGVPTEWEAHGLG